MTHTTPARLRACVVGVTLLAMTVLTGCGTDAAAPPAPTTSSSAPAPEPTPEPDPVLVPGGTADENLPYFDFVNRQLELDGVPPGQVVVDNLVQAGFDKAAMQVTRDATPRGAAVDSIQFSVQFGDRCLIGQIGAAGYSGVAVPALGGGGCLVGATRPIDW